MSTMEAEGNFHSQMAKALSEEIAAKEFAVCWDFRLEVDHVVKAVDREKIRQERDNSQTSLYIMAEEKIISGVMGSNH